MRKEHGYLIVKKVFLKLWLTLSIGGVLIGITFALAVPLLIKQISNGEVVIDMTLSAAFGVLLGLQIANFSVGVFLTDSKGLKFQSFWISIGAVLFVPAAILLTETLGIVGPTLAGAAFVACFQLIPNSCFVALKQKPSKKK
jgi:hypothetical protein